MADECHISWAILGSQAHQVVMKYYIHHPMQTVLDSPMGAGDV